MPNRDMISRIHNRNQDSSNLSSYSYRYDALGRRTERIQNGSVINAPSIATYQLQSSNFTLQTSYTWGLDLSQSLQGAGGVGGLLGVEELSGTYTGVYHIAFDANGNVTEVLDDSGGIAAHYEYSPFGEIVRSSGSYADANPFRFSTKYWDEETDFYYYGYRHYDPVTGRWLSRDPIGELGGLLLYNFVRNNPLSLWDYLGLRINHQGNYTQSNIDQFNSDMSTIANSGDAGSALNNWANSPDTQVDVNWVPGGNAAGGAGNPDGSPNPSAGGIQLNTDSPNYAGPGNTPDLSIDSVTALSHELGHSAGFDSESSVINLVEGEIREDRGMEPRTEHRNYPDGLPEPTEEERQKWEDFKDQWGPDDENGGPTCGR